MSHKVITYIQRKNVRAEGERAFDGNITLVQREGAYVEGELAFKAGTWRSSNPYVTSSPTLEQVWWNGWDHGRRRGKLD